MAMPGEIILKAEKLSKLYARRERLLRRRLGDIAQRAFFGGRLPDIGDLKQHEFWALRDVSFELKRGEALGVIGLNGSGKTTLLRILAGQILPDDGEVRITGTSASMIDLTAGFQPAATGMRNIFLRAAALGFTQKETRAMLEEIIDFSELGDALDAPMSTYSSGMRMRLAFSVMAMVQPDVLLIDEVLAVGDFRFRQKCLARVREMRDRSAFVFVSHSMGDVGRFCDRVIVLHKGRTAFVGDPDNAIEFYLSLDARRKPKVEMEAHKPRANAALNEPALLDLSYYSPVPYLDSTTLEGVSFVVNDRGPTGDDVTLTFGERISFEVTATVLRPCRRFIAGFTILTEDGRGISGIASDSQQQWLEIESAPRSVVATVNIPNIALNPGRYTVLANMRDGPELLLRTELFKIEVLQPPHNVFGVATIPHTWDLRLASGDRAGL